MKVQTRWDVPVQHSSRARRGSPLPSCVALSASVPSVPLTLPSHPHMAVKGLASEPQSVCAPPLLRALPGLLPSPVNLPLLPVAVSHPLPLIHTLLTTPGACLPQDLCTSCFLSGRHLPLPPFLYCHPMKTQPNSVYSYNPYPPPGHFHLLALLSLLHSADYYRTCCKCDLSYLLSVSTRRG